MRFRACLAVSLLFCFSCHSPVKQTSSAPTRRLNLVLITIDTLRPDRLGCYGASNVETPNLDHLAAGGALFADAVTHTPLTAPSHASIFTGLYPTVHKVRDTGGFILDTPHATLAEILRREGWDTAAFVGASVLKKHFGFDRGFAVYDDRMPRPDPRAAAAENPERRAGEVIDHAIAWLAAQRGRPYFLWVHLYDPHFPYDPPAPFREKYRDRPYDGEVAYVDRELGRLFAAAAQKSPADTLTAVLSDHGESLGEHGEYTHGVFLYDSCLRVAFLMAGPGIPRGVRVEPQARVIDLLPTVLELMGGRAPADIQGVSLAPCFRGLPPRPVYSYAETLYPKINHGWAELRGIRGGGWKYIRAPEPELYNLGQDPLETHNVIAAHPHEQARLEAALKAVLAVSGGETETVQTASVDPRTLAQLKTLGYLGGSAPAVLSLGRGGADPKNRREVLKALFLSVSPGIDSRRRIDLLRRALAGDAGDPGLSYHLGDAYSKAGRFQDELALYQDGIRRGMRNSWLYARIGRLYIRRGDKPRAIEALEEAVRLNASDTDSLNDLAMAYLETQRIDDAGRTFQWILATDDRYAPAYNGLGLVAVQRHDMDAARGHFENAVQFDPDLLEAQLNLGRIYKNMGANTRARACWETFLAKANPAEYAAVIPRIKSELAALR